MCVVGSGLCDELITLSEELRRVCGSPNVCGIQTLTTRLPRPCLDYYSAERNVKHLNCCKLEPQQLNLYSRIKIWTSIVFNDTRRLCYAGVGSSKGCNSVTGSGLQRGGKTLGAYFSNSLFSTVCSETEYRVSPPLHVLGK